MPEELKVNVVLTKQDIKQYYLESNIRRLIIWVVVYALFVVCYELARPSRPGFLNEFMFVFPLLVLAIMVFAGFLALISIFKYKRLIREFNNNRNFEKKLFYAFGDNGYSVKTNVGSITTSWSDIFKITEYKNFFIIERTAGRHSILPKRCFFNAFELDRFRNIVDAALDKKKRRLKNYPFAGFAPDTSGDIRPEPFTPPANETPVISIRVVLRRIELLRLTFYLFYTRPVGIMAAVLGLVLLIAVAAGAVQSVFIAVLGVILCIGFPAALFLLTLWSYKTVYYNGMTYEFYKDRMMLYTEKGINVRGVGDFYRLQKLSWGYLLFLSSRLTYIIPRRCIGDPTAFDCFFSYLKDENRRMKSAAAANPTQQSRYCTKCGTLRPSPAYKYCSNCGKEYPVK